MRKPLLWIAGAVGLIWLVNRTARAAYNIAYSVAGFAFTNSEWGNFVVNVRMVNNSAVTIPLMGATIQGNITLNNSVYLGRAVGTLDMLLPANGALVVPVFLDVQPDYLAGGAVALMQLVNKTGVELTFNGALTVAGLSQPVAVAYKLL